MFPTVRRAPKVLHLRRKWSPLRMELILCVCAPPQGPNQWLIVSLWSSDVAVYGTNAKHFQLELSIYWKSIESSARKLSGRVVEKKNNHLWHQLLQVTAPHFSISFWIMSANGNKANHCDSPEYPRFSIRQSKRQWGTGNRPTLYHWQPLFCILHFFNKPVKKKIIYVQFDGSACMSVRVVYAWMSMSTR